MEGWSAAERLLLLRAFRLNGWLSAAFVIADADMAAMERLITNGLFERHVDEFVPRFKLTAPGWEAATMCNWIKEEQG